MAYEWAPKMGEISGFGGDYEAGCRLMVKAGCEWLDAHPDADPKFTGFKGVYGIIREDNADAKALSEVMVDAARDCTGAMHQATVGAVLFIKAQGWDAYRKAMEAQR